jgi:hypothetical protein
MHVDPEWLRRLRPVVVQEAQNTDDDDQQEHDPMKGYGPGAVAPRGWQRLRRFQGFSGHREFIPMWYEEGFQAIS